MSIAVAVTLMACKRVDWFVLLACWTTMINSFPTFNNTITHSLSLSLSHTHTHTRACAHTLFFFSMPIRDWIRLWISANKIRFKAGLKWWFRRLEKSLPFLASPGSSYLSNKWVFGACIFMGICVLEHQYVTLQKCFSHSSLVICFFPTPPIKLKLGLQIGRRRLIVTHPETNQKLSR
jgi:hypothetical protein